MGFQARGLVCVGADMANDCGNEDKASNLKGQLFGAVRARSCNLQPLGTGDNSVVTRIFKKDNKNIH